jgi:GxxExxY protein
MTESDPRTYAIIGAAMEVHRVLGHGFLEAVYQEALTLEFELRNIPFEREAKLPIEYKSRRLDKHYIADFICFDEVLVECKAQSGLTATDQSQVLNYLSATRLKTSLLINFGQPSLEYQRIVL